MSDETTKWVRDRMSVTLHDGDVIYKDEPRVDSPVVQLGEADDDRLMLDVGAKLGGDDDEYVNLVLPLDELLEVIDFLREPASEENTHE